MTFEGEDYQQDANSGESSAAPETSTENQPEVTASESPDSSSQPAQQSRPFHEDPKIQEFIQRQVAKQASAYEERMQQLQQRFEEMGKEKQPSKAHPFVQKLKEIDPTYGEWAESQEKLAEKLAQFEQWQQEQQRGAVIQQYESGVQKLHAEYKVSPDLQEIYREAIDAAAMKNPKLGLKDLPDVYKQVHDRFSKLLDSTKRAERASYVVDKSKDANAPTSQSKGVPTVNNGKRGSHSDKESAYAAIVKNALKGSKAASDI